MSGPRAWGSSGGGGDIATPCWGHYCCLGPAVSQRVALGHKWCSQGLCPAVCVVWILRCPIQCWAHEVSSCRSLSLSLLPIL